MQFRTLIRLWHNRSIAATIACLALLSVGTLWMNADEPYARSRDYDLEHSRIALRFDVTERKIIGDVNHSVSVLRNGTDKISFDSVGLQIQSVTVNKAKAKFDTTDTKLTVALPERADEIGILAMHAAGFDPHDLAAAGIRQVAGAGELAAARAASSLDAGFLF